MIDAAISSAEPYQARPIRFLGVWEDRGWRMKIYEISRGGGVVNPVLVDAARRVTRLSLPAARASQAPQHYGVGFVGIHQGRGANMVFVDWWSDENELRHHVYASTMEAPADLRYVTPDGLAGCIWDLGLVAFERNAWVETVLRTPGPEALEAYLARTASGEL